MTMTVREVGAALAMCAVHDRREISDVDLEAWTDAAEDGGWSFAILKRVIREWYTSDAERPRLRPAHVTDRLKQVRYRALEIFDADRPPIGNGETPGQYLQRYRAERAMFANELVGLWAADGTDPAVEARRRQLERRQQRAIEPPPQPAPEVEGPSGQ